MRRPLAILPPILLALACSAQQIPQYTQYVFNHFSINPAVAGSKDCMDIRLGYRKQWVGFEGAPVTTWASLHAVLRKKGKPFIANRHGIGAWVEADDTGPLGYTAVYLAYAYHIQMAKDHFLSLGLFAGMKQEKLDAGKVSLADFDDPAVTGSKAVLIAPVITPGIWYYSKTSYLGLSIHQVSANKFSGFGVEPRLTRHYLLSGGRRFRIGRISSVMPSALLKISPGSPMAMDLSVMVEWKKQFGIGASYRNGDALALMAKFSFLKFFQVGYSYDITTSKVRLASSNTHEIVLAITPCPPNDPSKMIVRCPVFE